MFPIITCLFSLLILCLGILLFASDLHQRINQLPRGVNEMMATVLRQEGDEWLVLIEVVRGYPPELLEMICGGYEE